jgi:2-polyprenyl-6-methoxyphenol hydroxylase-like FAD-dependent oxidoreductase
MNETVIIVGGGPAGMACALELSKRGFIVQIVERRRQRSKIGKATGINLGIFLWLEKHGIQLDDAIPMRNFVFHDDNKKIASIQVPEIDGKPPAFMFPQTLLEDRLETVLQDIGLTICYGIEASNPQQSDRQAVITLTDLAGNTTRKTAQWIIAADGGHSPLREALGVRSIGRNYPEQWQVGEICTDQWDPDLQAQLYLQGDGTGLFLSQPMVGVVQGILNGPHLFAAMQEHFPETNFRYLRDFRVQLKQVEKNRHGRFWLIGDAAHTQSPVGGQGLNLAIFDAMTLGMALGAVPEETIEKILHQRARKTMLFTDFDYRMLSTRSSLLRHARNTYWRLAARNPGLARWFFQIIAGL